MRVLMVCVVLLFFPAGVPAGESGSQSAADLAPGVFLYAVPELSDMHFFHTVVLLVTYTPEGAMGLVINRPTELHAAEVIPDLEAEADGPPVLYYGGPVAREQVFVVLRSETPPEGALEIFGRVFLSVNRRVLDEKIKEKDADRNRRVYADYAGWAPGQLDREMVRGDWIMGEPAEEAVFAEDPEAVWPEIFNLKEQIEVRSPAPVPLLVRLPPFPE